VARCTTDTNGDDEGKVGCRELVLRRVTVNTAPTNSHCGELKIQPLPRSIMPLRELVKGDTEMDGHRPYVRNRVGCAAAPAQPAIIGPASTEPIAAMRVRVPRDTSEVRVAERTPTATIAIV